MAMNDNVLISKQVIEHRSTEDALRQSEQKFRSLVEQSQDGALSRTTAERS